MSKLSFQRIIFPITLGAFWAFSLIPAQAQLLSSSDPTDPEVLVSPPLSSNNDHDTGQNVATMLVDIKAVDAPALHTENGRTGVGSEIRYGQGIIIDPAGIIATNRHITGHARHIYVALAGGKIFEASILRNSQADLSLIKIDVPFPLRAMSLADPSEIQIGINVIAVANAGHNPQRMRGGQVINVFKETSTDKVELLEMNIPLNPGDSGGPVLNEDGSLLGLIMGKQKSDPTKSYAIASNRIQQEYFDYRNSILD